MIALRAGANTGTEFLPATEVIGALARCRCVRGLRGRRVARRAPGATSYLRLPSILIHHGGTETRRKNQGQGKGAEVPCLLGSHLFSLCFGASVVPFCNLKDKELRP